MNKLKRWDPSEPIQQAEQAQYSCQLKSEHTFCRRTSQNKQYSLYPSLSDHQFLPTTRPLKQATAKYSNLSYKQIQYHIIPALLFQMNTGHQKCSQESQMVLSTLYTPWSSSHSEQGRAGSECFLLPLTPLPHFDNT